MRDEAVFGDEPIVISRSAWEASQARLARLEALLEASGTAVAAPSAAPVPSGASVETPAHDVATVSPPPATSRRRMLTGLAGVAAGGAILNALDAQPAAANTGDALILGNTGQTQTSSLGLATNGNNVAYGVALTDNGYSGAITGTPNLLVTAKRINTSSTNNFTYAIEAIAENAQGAIRAQSTTNGASAPKPAITADGGDTGINATGGVNGVVASGTTASFVGSISSTGNGMVLRTSTLAGTTPTQPGLIVDVTAGPVPTNPAKGVQVDAANGVGVQATSIANFGVWGRSTTSHGVVGRADTGSGVQGSAKGGIGVYGYSDDNTGTGVKGTSNGAGKIGVQGTSTDGDGVSGTGDNGRGVVGTSTTGTGVAGTSTSGAGVTAASDSATALLARSSSGAGVDSATQTGVAGAFASNGAQLLLSPFTTRDAPTTDGTAHARGEIIRDSNGDLWCCTVAGTPGTWRKMSGPSTAGQFHVLAAPARIYDSRPGSQPPQGPKTKLSGNVARPLDLTVNNSGVPVGATAAVITILLVNAANANGNLTIWANGVPRPASNTMVWGAGSGRYTTLAVSALDADAKIQISASAATDVVLDVVGYYR